MAKVYNAANRKQLRQQLRNNPTQAEILMWSKLRHSALGGFKFRRQAGVGNYVIDFYCPTLQLARLCCITP